jgi:tetratricopeptide (TPR) repeat protein
MGNPKSAIDPLKKAIELDPAASDNETIVPLLVIALNEAEQHGEALRTLEEWGKTLPKILEEPMMHLQQGIALNAAGQPEAALEALGKFQESGAEPEMMGFGRLQQGLAVQMLGDHKTALTHFQAAEKLIRIPLGRALLWLHQARSQIALQNSSAANEALDHAAREPGPFLPAFLWQRGVLLNTLGRWDDALADLDAYLSAAPEAGAAWDQKASALASLGRFPEAVTALNSAIEFAPTQPVKTRLLLLKSQYLIQTSNADSALTTLEEAARIDPEIEKGAQFVALQVRALLSLSKLKEAAELIRSTKERAEVANDPSFQLFALDSLAACDMDAMIEFAKSIAAQEPQKNNGLARWTRGAALAFLGSVNESVQELTEAKTVDPSLEKNPGFLTYYIGSLANTGQYEEAMRAADMFVTVASSLPNAHSFRGLALANLERNEEATAEFDKAVELSGPDTIGKLLKSFTLVQKGGVLTAMKQWGNAIETFEKARSLAEEASNFPNQVNALVGQALAVYGRSRTEEESAANASKLEALRLVSNAVGLAEHSVPDPVRAAAWWSKGNILSLLERDEEALIAYAQARKFQPHAAGILLSLGVLYERLEDNERAIEAFSEAAKHGIQPATRAEAWLGKGRALQHLERDEEAIAACREAIALNGENEQILLLLGTAYSALGRHKAALAAFRRGWGLGKPHHRSAELALGVSAELLNLDRNAEARSFLEKAEKDTTFTGQMHLNYGIALYRLKDTGAAAKALRKATQAGVPGAEEYADKLAGGGQSRSWLDFWFGPTPWMRKSLGCVLLVILGLALLPAFLTPDALCFLPWLDLSKDWKVMLIPIVLVAALLVLPILTRFSVGPIEVGVSQPEPKAATLDLDSALKALQSISSTTLQG